MAQVELKGVSKSFGKIEVIRNVDLEINKGEFVAVSYTHLRAHET